MKEIRDSFKADSAAGPAGNSLQADGWALTFRCPTSGDLLAAQSAGGADRAAERTVLERCVLSACHQGKSTFPAEIPEHVLSLLPERMTAWRPGTDVDVALRCPRCDERWASGFDVGGYVWIEIAAAAQRLLWEIHLLARTYGWTEAEILALPANRRRTYLEMICG
jgi:hypothetical protein